MRKVVDLLFSADQTPLEAYPLSWNLVYKATQQITDKGT
jgi:hypothetical protein